MGMVQRLANRSLDLLFLPGMGRLWRQRLLGKVHCLLYHRVDEPGRVPFLDRFGTAPIPPRNLMEELVFLKMNGARFFTFYDLRRGQFPAPDEFGVIVCLDDGLRCNYSSGLGVLERLNIRAVIFQSTALIDAPTLIWEHSLYWHGAHPRRAERLQELAHRRLPSSRPYSGDALVAHLRDAEPMVEVEALLAELNERSGSGEVLAELAGSLYPSASYVRAAWREYHEIGSHGHHHYPRSGLDAAAFEQELIRSQQELAAILGRRPKAFSYPFNSHLPGDEAICARYYDQVGTVDPRPITGSTPPLEMPRCTWPGPHRNQLQRRRWLWTGHI
jgi:peptidoglycan/xylan/chitin deacetylase (PgdA/CDA1 family)